MVSIDGFKFPLFLSAAHTSSRRTRCRMASICGVWLLSTYFGREVYLKRVQKIKFQSDLSLSFSNASKRPKKKRVLNGQTNSAVNRAHRLKPLIQIIFRRIYGYRFVGWKMALEIRIWNLNSLFGFVRIQEMQRVHSKRNRWLEILSKLAIAAIFRCKTKKMHNRIPGE